MNSYLVQNIIQPIQSKETICAGPFCTAINDPGSAIGALIVKSVALLLILGGFFLLLYLLWGGLDWILSRGEKERLVKAQEKLTHAVIGFLILFCVWTIWGFLTGDVLGIIKKQGGRWTIAIPQF